MVSRSLVFNRRLGGLALGRLAVHKMLTQRGSARVGLFGSSILAWIRRGWVCLVFFVLQVALGRRLGGRVRGRRWGAGRRSIFRTVYSVSGYSYPAYRRWLGLAGACRWMLL